MADAIFRIPSRTVQYGYVEISVPAAPDAPPEMLAARYVSYVYAFQKEEEAAIERIKKGVSAPVTASQEASPGDPQAAAERLAGGRSPRTVDEANEMARQVIESELGPTTEVSDGAPWNQEVAPKRKPWETEASKPKAQTEDW